MNNIKICVLSVFAILSFSACSHKQEVAIQSDEIKREIIEKNVEVEKYKKEMLKNNEHYSEQHLKQSLYENYKTNNEKPLYKNPQFAVITIFPYVSDDGIYHEYERVWIKVQEGDFVLNQNGNLKNKGKNKK
ncbi:TraV family lipoprotein [Campylobacter sp. RM12651]|uniref:TraV family lipoprotein n=1 Tax=Campylobacter sp. RM12651 TaxID=1660079 RepID=UPI001EFC1280|nr:TraV family lipoprotein [Campylobacter sp. RM12651]ULO03833.1 F-type type IV conjugative transfer system protein TraV [Campylobacter sp. RM12651]